MIQLSIVIPAFNESQRLPPYLREILAYGSELRMEFEVVVVNDGSTDGLSDVLRHWHSRTPHVRFVEHERNLGKGAAVRTGVRASRGELVLFTDADGATPIREEQKLRAAIERGADLAIGSRRDRSASAQRTYGRRVAAAAFSYATRTVLGLAYRDTQCGFKMFRAAVARSLFGLLEERRFLFDAELLWWAEKMRYRVEEVPVTWSEKPGGQVRLMRDGASMLLGLVRLRRRLQSRMSELEKPPAAPIQGTHRHRKLEVLGRR